MAYNGKYTKPSAGARLMRVAFVLLCLVILTVYLMGSLLARYHATGSGDDEARVAKFEVNLSGQMENDKIVCKAVPSDDGTYVVTIENKSEVAVHYDLKAEITSENVAGVTYRFDQDKGNLAPGATGTSNLTFTVDWDEFTKEKTGSKATATLSFTVTADVTQID